jgi:hypothetical protein
MMTALKLRVAMEALDLNQTSLARTLDVSRRLVAHWAASARPVPATAAMLLNLLLACTMRSYGDPAVCWNSPRVQLGSQTRWEIFQRHFRQMAANRPVDPQRQFAAVGRCRDVGFPIVRSTGQRNTACSLSAGVSKPKVFRGR